MGTIVVLEHYYCAAAWQARPWAKWDKNSHVITSSGTTLVILLEYSIIFIIQVSAERINFDCAKGVGKHPFCQPHPEGGDLGDVTAHCNLQAVPSLGHKGLAVLLGLLLSREEFSPIRPEVFVLALRVLGSIGKSHGSSVGCNLSNLRDLGVECIYIEFE